MQPNSNHDDHGGHGKGVKNDPHQHAFVVLGLDVLFLCHLTMFKMEEHMYQVVLQAALPDQAMKEFVDYRKRKPNETFFLGNSAKDLFTIPELQARERSAFECDIFEGIPKKKHYDDWPWKGVTPIIKTRVVVERVVYYRHFDFNFQYPSTLTYILFGRGREAHMTNYQTKEPDFDHVLDLAEVPEWLPPTQLEAGIHVNFPGIPTKPSKSPTYCSNPLDETQYEVQYQGYGPVYTIRVGRTHWFGTDILNLKNPCPVEPRSELVEVGRVKVEDKNKLTWWRD